MAKATVHPTAHFVLVLSEIEARDLALALGEGALAGNLPGTTYDVWQALNSKVIDYDTQYIDGGN